MTSSDGVPASYQGLPTTWMHLDITLTNGPTLSTIRRSDQAGVGTFLSAIGSAEQTGPGAYRGTLKGQNLYGWQDPPATVPFTATVDGKGRLLTFEATARAAGRSFDYTATFSEYGLPVAITAPADAVEAPRALYTLLG